MNMDHNFPKSRAFFAAKGFYIALALSLAAVGAAAYFVFVSVPAMTAPAVDNADADTAATGETVETVDTATLPVPQESAPVVSDTQQESTPVVGTVGITVNTKVNDTQPMEEIEPQIPMLRIAPLEGETVAVFSATQLQYNKTLADWRMHDGIDIAAEEGSHVLAACSGVVKSVGKDDMMGMRIVLSHSDGYETCYANLGEDVFVSEGEYVSAGQAVGTVGTSSLAEAADGAHLHFGVRYDGVAVDPQKYLGE